VIWWHFFVGILLSHLPDIDAVPELMTRGRVSASSQQIHDHRTFLHYPVIALVIGTGMVWWLGYWGLVAAIAIALHLINDLYGTGWGLKLFWPISQRSYKVCGRRANRLRYILQQDGDWERLPSQERQLRILVSWSTSELPDYIKRWGIDAWIPLWYYRLNWVSGIEYGLFVMACIGVVVTLSN
jgi:hypothetical protein